VKEFAARLQALEDRLEILDLIASYGPAADSADAEKIAEIWAEDGDYTFGVARGSTTLAGAQVPALVDLPGHRDYLRQGCGHILTTPAIDLDGDRALATNHSLVVVKEGDRWVIDRASANRWELERTPGAGGCAAAATLCSTGANSPPRCSPADPPGAPRPRGPPGNSGSAFKAPQRVVALLRELGKELAPGGQGPIDAHVTPR